MEEPEGYLSFLSGLRTGLAAWRSWRTGNGANLQDRIWYAPHREPVAYAAMPANEQVMGPARLRVAPSWLCGLLPLLAILQPLCDRGCVLFIVCERVAGDIFPERTAF